MKNEIEKTRIDKILSLHEEIAGYLKLTLDRAIHIGGLLTEQKADLQHGQWLPWIRENMPFSKRLAQDYIRFYEHREELKSATLAGLTDARRYLTPPKEKSADSALSTIRGRGSLFSAMETYFERLPADVRQEANTLIERLKEIMSQYQQEESISDNGDEPEDYDDPEGIGKEIFEGWKT